jgi:ribosome-binding factor A
MATRRAGRRPERLAEQVRQAVTTFLQEDARDPRIGLVTITRVRVGADLQRATVLFVVHGDAAAQAQSLDGLTHAAVAIRRRLAETLRVRTVPEIVFEPDRGLEHARRIEQLLATLRKDEGAGP